MASFGRRTALLRGGVCWKDWGQSAAAAVPALFRLRCRNTADPPPRSRGMRVEDHFHPLLVLDRLEGFVDAVQGKDVGNERLDTH